MQFLYRDRDPRNVLSAKPLPVDPYTVQRIRASYDRIPALLRSLPPLERCVALDVGCGSGFDTFAIAGFCDHVIGEDVSRRAIREARRIARAAKVSGVSFFKRDSAAAGARGPFGLIYCNLMSHNVRARVSFLSGLATRLQPGGILIYSEESEGYPLSEISTAVKARDVRSLIQRLNQAVRVLNGTRRFRCFLSGTAGQILAASGLHVTAHCPTEWQDVTLQELYICRRTDAPIPTTIASEEPDYIEVPHTLRELRAHYRALLRLPAADRVIEGRRIVQSAQGPVAVLFVAAVVSATLPRWVHTGVGVRSERVFTALARLVSVNWDWVDELIRDALPAVRSRS